MVNSRSQGLSSYRPLRRARRDPGTRWSRAALTIENIWEGSSVIRQFVALSVVGFKVSRCAATPGGGLPYETDGDARRLA